MQNFSNYGYSKECLQIFNTIPQIPLYKITQDPAQNIPPVPNQTQSRYPMPSVPPPNPRTSREYLGINDNPNQNRPLEQTFISEYITSSRLNTDEASTEIPGKLQTALDESMMDKYPSFNGDDSENQTSFSLKYTNQVMKKLPKKIEVASLRKQNKAGIRVLGRKKRSDGVNFSKTAQTVPCSSRNYTRVLGEKKYSGENCRTVYTELQKTILEQEYLTNRYLSAQSRATLTKLLRLEDRQINNWFQNRRNKERKAASKKRDFRSFSQSSSNTVKEYLINRLVNESSDYNAIKTNRFVGPVQTPNRTNFNNVITSFDNPGFNHFDDQENVHTRDGSDNESIEMDAKACFFNNIIDYIVSTEPEVLSPLNVMDLNV